MAWEDIYVRSNNSQLVQGYVETVGGAVSGGNTNSSSKNKDKGTTNSTYTNTSLVAIDMARESNFTVEIKGIEDNTYNLPLYNTFLPVKNIQYDPVEVESVNIPTGIFGQFPLISGIKTGNITLVLYDNDDSRFEYAISNWFSLCSPTSGYAPYMAEITSVLTYRSYYSVYDSKKMSGLPKMEAKFLVMPSKFSVGRDTEHDALKLINLNLTVLGVVQGMRYMS